MNRREIFQSAGESPVLAEVTRGPVVESVHRGALAIVTSEGEVVLALGDLHRPYYPRSAIKALQTVPVVASGAADAFGLDDRELAVACASHGGTAAHVAAVRHLMQQAGLREADLACGAHWPLDSEAGRKLAREGRGPSAVHNNCSGKHAGMIATAKHLGMPLEGYERIDHPLQVMVRETIEAFADAPLADAPVGTDGCSVPTWALPLPVVARSFARFATGDGLSESHGSAARRLFDACVAEPVMVDGERRFVTEVLARADGAIFLKGGAEGFYCAGFRESGLGLALKIDDGARRASETVLAAVIARLLPHVRDLRGLTDRPLRNWRGVLVGEHRPSEALLSALETVPSA